MAIKVSGSVSIPTERLFNEGPLGKLAASLTSNPVSIHGAADFSGSLA